MYRGSGEKKKIRIFIKEAWDKVVDKHGLENLEDSMPREVRTVFDNGDGYQK